MSDLDPNSKEWRLLERVVMTHSTELKKSRRWGILFKSLTFVYLFALLIFVVMGTRGTSSSLETSTGGHTAVIDVKGVISADADASADHLVSSLRKAYGHPDTKQVILRINSPGGSPVQSGYVNDEIWRLKSQYGIPTYAVIADTGASGAYYIAAAADEIYADKASLVGSIGVTAASFGFEELIEKLGISRRQFTSGDHKAFLDPFLPVKEDEKAHFESVLNNVHQQFIEVVKRGRGERIREADFGDLFSGLMWTGEQALNLGLVDGLASTSQLAREKGHEKLVDFSYKPDPFENFSRQLGLSTADALANKLMSTQLQ